MLDKDIGMIIEATLSSDSHVRLKVNRMLFRYCLVLFI